MRIVAILDGGDWTDASCEHLVVPEGVDLVAAAAAWRCWYEETYLAKNGPATVPVPYMSFTDWLKTHHGATEAPVEEFWRP